MLVASLFLVLAAIAPFGLYMLGKSEERHEVRLSAIAASPIPQLPMQFKWRGWAIGLKAFLWLILLLPCIATLYASPDYKILPIIWIYAALSISVGFHVLPLILWYFSGPAFVLSSKFLRFAGKEVSWSEISSVRYATNGRGGSFVVFDLRGRKIRLGFFLHSSIKCSALCIENPDELIGYSQRLLAAAPFLERVRLNPAEVGNVNNNPKDYS